MVGYGGFTPTVSETRAGITRTMIDTSWVGGMGLGLYSASSTSNPVP